MNVNQKNHIGLFILVIGVAAVSRFYGLDRLGLWADELWVVMGSSRGTFWQMLNSVYYQDNHPPGYYILLRFIQIFFGSGDFTLRLPSALAGVALVGATFITGRKLFSTEAAIIAAALVAGSYTAIYFSQEVRPNIFLALFALLAFHYFYIVLLQGERLRKNYILFWVFAASCSYFHYSGLVFCFCLGLIYLVIAITKRQKTQVSSGLILFLPLLLIYSPWLFGLFHHLVSTPVAAWQRPPDFNTLKTTFFILFGPDNPRMVFYLVIFLAALAYLGRAAVLCIMTMIVLPVAIFFIKSLYSQDAYNHRHFLYAAPLMALLSGYLIYMLIERVQEKNRSRVFVAVIFIIIFYQAAANNGRALYTANHFKQEFREGARVVADDLSFIKLADGMIVSNIYFFDHYLKQYARQRQSDFIFDSAQKITDLTSGISTCQAKEFYYLEAPIIPGANKMVTAEDVVLMHRYQALCRTRFARVQVFKFSVLEKSTNEDVTNLPDCRVNEYD